MIKNKARPITEDELNEVKTALRLEREKSKRKLDAHLIKVLELKPDRKYMLFFPKTTGLSHYELEGFNSEWLADISFLVGTTEGIVAIEKKD